jgi:hypothetical protein
MLDIWKKKRKNDIKVNVKACNLTYSPTNGTQIHINEGERRKR